MAYKLPFEMIELSEAALLAQGRLFSATLRAGADALDVVATALSGHMSVFGFRTPYGAISELTEDDYSKGAFRGGATRFEFRGDQESIIVLGVRKTDLDLVLKKLIPPRGDPKGQ